MKDTTASIAYFKRHWLQYTINIQLNEADMKILYDLSKK
jgi:hypothetical protein